MPVLFIVLAFLLSGCGCNCTPQTATRQQTDAEPQEAGSINCTIDARHCTAGQRR